MKYDEIVLKYWDFSIFSLPCWIARGYSLSRSRCRD